jgi:hypothetical protein
MKSMGTSVCACVCLGLCMYRHYSPLWALAFLEKFSARLSNLRYFSHSSVSEEHLTGLAMSVMTFLGGRQPTWPLLLHNSGDGGPVVGTHYATMGADVTVGKYCFITMVLDHICATIT